MEQIYSSSDLYFEGIHGEIVCFKDSDVKINVLSLSSVSVTTNYFIEKNNAEYILTLWHGSQGKELVFDTLSSAKTVAVEVVYQRNALLGVKRDNLESIL